MSDMIVVARFKGKDGSKGYQRGKEYTLIFQCDHPGLTISDMDRATPKDSGGSLVQYTSLVRFLDNWEVIK